MWAVSAISGNKERYDGARSRLLEKHWSFSYKKKKVKTLHKGPRRNEQYEGLQFLC